MQQWPIRKLKILSTVPKRELKSCIVISLILQSKVAGMSNAIYAQYRTQFFMTVWTLNVTGVGQVWLFQYL